MTEQELKNIGKIAVKIKEHADSIKQTNKELYDTCDELLISLSNEYLFNNTTDNKSHRSRNRKPI